MGNCELETQSPGTGERVGSNLTCNSCRWSQSNNPSRDATVVHDREGAFSAGQESHLVPSGPPVAALACSFLTRFFARRPIGVRQICFHLLRRTNQHPVTQLGLRGVDRMRRHLQKT